MKRLFSEMFSCTQNTFGEDILEYSKPNFIMLERFSFKKWSQVEPWLRIDSNVINLIHFLK